MERKPLGIYLHIPFCVRKCNYCDFLSAPASPEIRRRYVECLKKEIACFEGAEQYRVESVFFGGGTPSLLAGTEIEEVMEQLRKKFVFSGNRRLFPEITMECNPGTLTEEKLKAYRECGINRLSIGLQSADDGELKKLGRIHTWMEFERNFYQARNVGFTNLNVDLMSSLPGQSPASWRKTLRKVLELEPEHISAYSLMIEEGTPFYDWYGEEAEKREKGLPCTLLPSEEEEREMYYDTDRFLKEAGMHRYEISNYALPGFESRHNCGYWQRKEYVGFGLGASSQLGQQRYKNTDCLTDYLKEDFSKQEVLELTRKDEIEETMYLGLRMMQGIDRERFKESFGIAVEEIYGRELEKLEGQGLLEQSGKWLRLTGRGIDLSNMVLAEFLMDDNV